MAVRYDTRRVSLAIIAAPLHQLVMLGNRNRVALNLSGDGDVATNLFVSYSTGATSDHDFLWMPPEAHLALPYRDWGPVIKESIYASCSSGAMNILVVETFIIPSSAGV